MDTLLGKTNSRSFFCQRTIQTENIRGNQDEIQDHVASSGDQLFMPALEIEQKKSVTEKRVQLLRKPSTGVVRKPLKERLIHILAVRPHNKMELYERLRKEGLRTEKILWAVLQLVSEFKDNCFHLRKVLWNDVRETWPFYSEPEREVVKRQKAQIISSFGLSGRECLADGQPSNIDAKLEYSSDASLKRPGYFVGVDGLPTKRLRVSHYHKQSTLKSENNDISKVSSSANYNRCHEISTVLREKNQLNNNNSLFFNKNRQRKFVNEQGVRVTSFEKTEVNNRCIPETNRLSTYMTDYPPIKSAKERRKYSDLFNIEHGRYLKMHEAVTELSQRFLELKNRLDKEKSNSETYQHIKRIVLKLYSENKENKEKFNILHEKLTHIKRMVSEYDQRMGRR